MNLEVSRRRFIKDFKLVYKCRSNDTGITSDGVEKVPQRS